MLKGFSGDKTQLGSAEKFLLAVISIPGYDKPCYLLICLFIYLFVVFVLVSKILGLQEN